jgi:hypothetical protein
MNINMVFDYICFSCYFYVPNKANKKKIKQLFEAIPYFLPEDKQNILFTITRNNPIETFYDKTSTMKYYGYMIYKDYHISEKKRYLEYNEYNDKFLAYLYKDRHIERRWVKHVIFISVVIGLIYFLYKNK